MKVYDISFVYRLISQHILLASQPMDHMLLLNIIARA